MSGANKSTESLPDVEVSLVVFKLWFSETPFFNKDWNKNIISIRNKPIIITYYYIISLLL
jgi:hypothetical protein